MYSWNAIMIVCLLAGCAHGDPAGVNAMPGYRMQPGLRQQDTLSWYRPRFSERSVERELLVRNKLKNNPYLPITSPAVLEAMYNVPRHEFVPALLQNEAYLDSPLPIGYGQTISQPFIVAHMTQLLNISPGDKILEIGTGSGYQAAVLSELTPYIFSIEIIPELAGQAKKTLRSLGYSTIKLKTGDGYIGWPEYAPYDGIIVTCAPEDIPPALIAQLKPGGRLVIPVGSTREIQYMVVVEKNERGKVKKKYHYPVRFVPMTRDEE